MSDHLIPSLCMSFEKMSIYHTFFRIRGRFPQYQHHERIVFCQPEAAQRCYSTSLRSSASVAYTVWPTDYQFAPVWTPSELPATAVWQAVYCRFGNTAKTEASDKILAITR